MLETDLILDRRRLKRRLNFWRVLAVLAGVAVLCVLAIPGIRGVGPHIVRLNVTGVINEDPKLDRAVRRLARDRSVPAVIVSIDSPGGAVAGGESLHDALLQVAKVKPVVAVMRGTAASAAYMIALPTTRIFARDSTLTGSIGVILQTGQVSGLLTKLGVTAEELVSGPLKGQPSFTEPLSPEGRQYLQGLVNDLFDQFVTMVADARHMDKDAVRKLATGQAYTGRQAVQLGLVDQIGGEQEARAWLAQAHGISDSTPVRDFETGNVYDRTFGAMTGALHLWLLGDTMSGAWSIWPGFARS